MTADPSPARVAAERGRSERREADRWHPSSTQPAEPASPVPAPTPDGQRDAESRGDESSSDFTEAVLAHVVSPAVGEIGLRVRDVIAIAEWLAPLVRDRCSQAWHEGHSAGVAMKHLIETEISGEAAGRYAICGDWLVSIADGCTCDGNGEIGHRIGCGEEPCERIDVLRRVIAPLLRLSDVPHLERQIRESIAGEEARLRGALLSIRSIGATSGTNLSAWNEAFDVIDAAIARGSSS
jgi:hypothetical protein